MAVHIRSAGYTLTIVGHTNGYSMAVACLATEAMATAKAGGVGLKFARDIMTAGPNHSDFFDCMMVVAMEGDESELSFTLKNGYKDMGYFDAMAKEVGVNTTLPEAAYARLANVVEASHGDEFLPALMRLATKKSIGCYMSTHNLSNEHYG